MIIEVSQGLGTFIGGILAEHSYMSCYLAVIFISAVSLIPAFLFTEPSITNKIHYSSDNKDAVINSNDNVVFSEINNISKFVQSIKNSLLFTHFKNSYYILKDNKEILKILIYFPIVETFNVIFFGIMNFANSLLYPIQSVSLNELIPSHQRATIISISSMIYNFN